MGMIGLLLVGLLATWSLEVCGPHKSRPVDLWPVVMSQTSTSEDLANAIATLGSVLWHGDMTIEQEIRILRLLRERGLEVGYQCIMLLRFGTLPDSRKALLDTVMGESSDDLRSSAAISLEERSPTGDELTLLHDHLQSVDSRELATGIAGVLWRCRGMTEEDAVELLRGLSGPGLLGALDMVGYYCGYHEELLSELSVLARNDNEVGATARRVRAKVLAR